MSGCVYTMTRDVYVSLLGQDELNKVKHDFFGHVIQVLASCDTAGIINTTNAFVSSR